MVVRRILITFLVLAPLLWHGWSWQAANGLPVFKDGNETWGSYIHARNLESIGWLRTKGVTVETTNTGYRDGPLGGYVHNPNLPRYGHYLLRVAGILDLRLHVLLLGCIGLTMAVAFAILLGHRLGPGLLALALPLALALDTMGFLSWSGNTYRVWSYPLLLGLLLAVAAYRLWLTALAAFMVCQFEYGFALYALGAAVVLAVLLHERRGVRAIGWTLLGAALSLTVFALQVLSFRGIEATWAEIAATLAIRGPLVDGGNVVAATWMALVGHYRQPLPILVLWSILTAPIALLWRGVPRDRRRLAALQVALIAGLGVSALLLRGYYLSAFVAYAVPGWHTLVLIGAATAAVDVAWGLSRIRLGNVAPLIGLLIVGAVMLPNIGYVFEKYPLQPMDIVPVLAERYQGRATTASGGVHLLTSALTGAAAQSAPPVVEHLTVADQYIRSLGSDGELYWVCLRREDMARCDNAVTRMVPFGHTEIERGDSYVIVKLAH